MRIKILVIIFGSLLALLIGELGFRILISSNKINKYLADPILGHRRIPLAQGTYETNEFKSSVRYNSLGFRDDEPTVHKPDDTLRILFLGDSFTEAIQVEQDSRFSSIITNKIQTLLDSSKYNCNGRIIKKVESLNFGVSGYGTTQELLVFKHIAKNYMPDIVILSFLSANDIQNNSVALEMNPINWDYTFRPYYVYDDNKTIKLHLPGKLSSAYLERRKLHHKILDSSTLLTFFYRRMALSDVGSKILHKLGLLSESNLNRQISIRSPLHLYINPEPKVWSDSWELTSHSFRELAQEVASINSEFYVVNIPNREQVVESAWIRHQELFKLFNYPNSQLNRMQPQLNFRKHLGFIGESFIDPTDIYASHAATQPTDLIYYEKDGHFTNVGHTMFSSFIFNFLTKHEKDTKIGKACIGVLNN
jgi:hypothetical protein